MTERRIAAGLPHADMVRSAVAATVIGSWIGYFLFTGMPQFSLLVFPRTLTLHLVLAGGVALYLVALAAMRRLPGGTPLDVPVLAFVAAYALAAILSINWRVSLEPLLFLASAAGVFLVLSGVPFLRARDLRHALLLAGGGLALYALWVVGNDYADYVRLVRRVEGLGAGNIFPPTVPRVHDVSDHPNVLAMVLTLVLPFFAVALVHPSHRVERWLGALGMLVGGMALFLTLSRGGWLGATVGIAIAVGGAWFAVEASRAETGGASWIDALPRQLTPTAIAAMLGAAVLIVGGTLAFLSSATTRPGWLFRGSLSPREDAWESSLDMFADHPWFGSGPHTFGLLYPQYSGEFLEHTQHAHNGFLQVANDAGLVGLLALTGLAVAVVYTLVRTWREGDLEQRLIAVACAGALAGFSIHNQLDAGNPWKAPSIALALVGAIMVRADLERAHARRRPQSGAPSSFPLRRLDRLRPSAVGAMLVILLIVPFAGWYWTDRAHYDYYLGADAYNRGESGAIERLQKAVDADSSNVAHRLLLGQALTRAFLAGDEQDSQLIARAVVHFEQAVRLDERSDIARANLARAYQLAGRPDDAAREAQVARLSVRHVPPVLAAGEVYEAIGRDADALDTYAQVLSMDASLADSTFWDGTPWRREHFDEIIGGSVIKLNPCTYGSYLVQTQRSTADQAVDGALAEAEDGCKLLLLEFPNDLTLRIALGRIMMAIGDLDGALEHLRYATERQPDFGPARTELGRWYAAEGRLDDARKQWILGSELDEPESVMLLGDSYDPVDRPPGLEDRLRDLLEESGSSVRNDVVSIVYFRMRWGRLSPIEAVVPGDWNTAVPRLYAQMQSALSRWESEAGD